MENFRNWQNEVIEGLNDKNLLGVNILKVGRGSSKRYVDSHFLIRVIDKQGEAVRRLNQKIQNYSKGINIMHTTRGYIEKELHNFEKRGNITQVNFIRWKNWFRLVIFIFCN